MRSRAPSSEASKPTLGSRLEGFFYSKLQYLGSVNQAERNKDQPVPSSLNIYEHAGPGATPDESVPDSIDRYEPPDAHGEDAAEKIDTDGEEKG